MSELIDIHAHFLPKRYLAAMRAAGIFAVDGFPIPEWSAENALHQMEQWGIKRQYLSISAPGISFVSGEAARSLARNVNEDLADIIARHPRAFGGFAILPLPDVEGALREIEFSLDKLKLSGVGLYTNFNGTYLGDIRFDSVFNELNRRGAVVYVHPVAPPRFDMAELGFPAAPIEYPFDTTRMIMNLISSGTRQRLPDFRMIVSHGGGTLPFLLPRIVRNLVRFGRVQATMDQVMSDLKSFYFDLASVSHLHAIDSILEVASKDRLLYGSDFPFMPNALVPKGIDFLYRTPQFDHATRNAISHQNAEMLFHSRTHS